MARKGVLYVPRGTTEGGWGVDPALDRVANRPLAGLIVEQLASAGVRSLAVVVPASRLDSVRSQVTADCPAALDLRFLPLVGPSGLGSAIDAADAFVGGDPVILHLATGMLAEPYEPPKDDRGEGIRLLLHHGHERSPPLTHQTERLLGVTALGHSGGRLSLAGVAHFGAGTFARAARRSGHTLSSGAAASRWPAHELVAIAEALAGDGLPVAAGLASAWYECATDRSGLIELNRSILDRQTRRVGPQARAWGNRIDGRVILEEGAEVRGSVILGPSLIGAGARISDAYIGPYTTVGPGAIIENCEILCSIVGSGAKLSHLGGRIEGSTIGTRSRVFREFRLPRALRLHVGEGVEIGFS